MQRNYYIIYFLICLYVLWLEKRDAMGPLRGPGSEGSEGSQGSEGEVLKMDRPDGPEGS